MYFQEDTVLRMIEMLGAAYRLIMRLLNDLEAEGELNRLFRQLTGLDRATAKGLSVETLSDMLTSERRMALSELMLLEVERFKDRMEPEDILAAQHRALLLLCTIENDEIASHSAERAREVFGQCAELCSPEETGSLLRFLRLGGAYAAAEDVLFLQLRSFARPGDIRTLVQLGEEFYAALLAESDERLRQGDLPREEVIEGQTALSAWAAKADGGNGT